MIIKKCLKCNKEFKSFPSDNRVYCSKKCFESIPKKWLLNNKHKKGKPSWNKGLKNWMSKEGKERMIKAKTGKKATKETRIKMSESHKGEKCNFWKGGVWEDNQKFRNCVEMKLWREAVFERDNYECQECNQERGKYITAHHIKSFAYYPKLRFEVSNGITLCKKCHEKTDNFRGKNKHKTIISKRTA